MEQFESVAAVLRALADRLDAMDEVTFSEEADVCPLPPLPEENFVARMFTGRRKITIEVREADAWAKFNEAMADRRRARGE